MSSSSNYYSPNNASLGSEISRVSSPDGLYINRKNGGTSSATPPNRNNGATSPAFPYTPNRNNGATSPTPSLTSSLGRVRSPTPSKRDRIRSKHPAPVHVSKLEAVLGNKKGQSIRPDEGVTTDIGISADEVYDEYLPSGVGWVRRMLIRSLRVESEWLAWHQPLVRTPLLDRYFVYTSLFGTHSFFLIFLPAAFWIGNPYFARGLVNTLAFGVYFSSAIKDSLCVPRPYSPPVTRLTVGSTHLEYGFPSTHSTNSVGTALYVWLWIRALREQGESMLGVQSVWWDVGLAAYAFSVVYGRVYAGMHSVVDCTAGSVLGAAITLVQWYGFDVIETFLSVPGWTVPVVLISSCLLMVSIHPEPLDDCPCFEDAIAFIAVVNGVSLGRWATLRYDWLNYAGDVNPLLSPVSASTPTTWSTTLLATAQGTLAVLCGVVLIFLVRVIIKTSCKLALPRIFRFVDNAFGFVLPRRHYVPSSEYTDVPMNNIIRSPSFMDLPSTLTPVASDGLGTTTAYFHSRDSTDLSLRGYGHLSRDSSSGDSDLIARSQSPSIQITDGEEIVRTTSPANLPSLTTRLQGQGEKIQFPPSPRSSLSVPITQPTSQLPSDRVANKVAAELSEDEKKRQELVAQGQVAHYDIDVLTKVIVYSNIGFWAACMIPTFLRWAGLL